VLGNIAASGTQIIDELGAGNLHTSLADALEAAVPAPAAT